MNRPLRLNIWTPWVLIPAILALSIVVPAIAFFVHVGVNVGAPPPMARGEILRFGTPSIEWTAILETQFPVGTPNSAVVAKLKGQGFEIEPSAIFTGRFNASYSWGGGFPCLYNLSVNWFVDADNRLEGIDGNYTNACL